MILVDELTIEEFRGIRKLTLKLNGKNFAVCGPNGTGKSGVVDALEFGLTGNISRLSGSGTGGISLKKHAPHVDFRDFPEKAKIKILLRIPSLKNIRVTLERNVKDANNPTITPNTPEVLEVLKQLENHPEFVLSRRELIAYVLAQPGQRSEEIQALLQLNKIGELRGTFKKISNACSKDATALKKISDDAAQSLTRALEISELKAEKLLEAVNSRRILLELAPITAFTATTVLHDGLKTTPKTPSSKINKAEAIADTQTTQKLTAELVLKETNEKYTEISGKLIALSSDPAIAASISKSQFLRTAITLISESACPVCDTEWAIETLKDLIELKLKKFEEASKKRTALETELAPNIDLLQRLHNSLTLIEKHSRVITPEKNTALSTYRLVLANNLKSLKNFLPLSETILALENITVIPEEVTTAMATIEAAIANIPEPSDQEAARDYLVLCHDRLETWREAARNAKKAKEHSELALSVHDIYAEESNKVLEDVYKQVENEFGEFYRSINSDDEGTFTAKLTPSLGKLGFDVEFYGRGHFPPGAYHSEGHQDGMGLCLYLALMQRLQGRNFTFAVLDDVLMSVDTGHRREVCNLLKKEFPHTQFILTTHDEVWLKHMGSAGLVNPENSVRFSNWTPEIGPTEWNNRDIWSEIEIALKANDVRSAASILRYYLEHIFKDVCHNLRAQVEFKGDGRYDLGDVLSPGVKRLRDILTEGKKAAESWSRTDDAAALVEREKNVADCLRISNADQWQINPAIHYNEWANLTATDFTPVVTAFHNLTKQFFCNEPSCKGLYYITGTSPKDIDTLRCVCGTTNINLKKKKH